MREDLPEIIHMGREKGFTFFQLNTNGIRLAQEAGYSRKLKKAGLNTVFLQFDGVTDDVYQTLRGLNFVFVSSPNNSFANTSSVPFKSANEIFLSMISPSI